MTPAVVVDIGNSRMKWARVAGGKLAQTVSLSLENPDDWKAVAWADASPWLITSVVPRATARLTEWLGLRTFTVLNNATLLAAVQDFRTEVEEPDRVGIDRLLNSYAAFRLANTAVAVISVGTALTIDFVATDGTHRGGAILPGPELMAKSLHEHTAKLPQIEIGRYQPGLACGVNTEQAIHLGVTRAAVQAADSLIADWAGEGQPFHIFITGGGHKLFRDVLFTSNWSEVVVEPALALEGLRLVAESLP